MEDNFTKVLEERIINVYDEFNNLLVFETKEIKKFKAKYSSAKPSLTLFLDGEPLTNNKKHKRKVTYLCDCGREKTILLCKYLTKNKMVCESCRETEEKIEWHKLFFEMKRNGEKRGHHKRKKVNYDFNSETEDFKNEYFSRNLTQEEFDNIKQHLYSINGVVVEGKNFELLISEPSFNAKRYRQMIKVDNSIIPFKDIWLKCRNCGKVYHITRMIKEKVLADSFECKFCAFNNKIFAIKHMEDGLFYQSNLEYNFIQKCKKRGINILNGPIIKYWNNNSYHFYTTDFFLPEYNIVIEIKDNHVWHKKQIENGIWKTKEENAVKYCQDNDMEFKLLFPKDIDEFFENL